MALGELTQAAWGRLLDTDLFYKASTWILPILIAVTFHEAAHAFAAWRLGDHTAYRLGRVTFNPLRHIDPVGTVLLPGILFITGAPFLFGWAKPVPVAFGRLRHPRRDMALVAVAGPLTNIVLALVSALLIHAGGLLPVSVAPWALQMLYQSILLNLVLAVFNMIPLPPLDGSRILMSFLPAVLARQYAKLERFGFLILIGVVILLPMLGRQMGMDLYFFRWIIGVPLSWLTPIFLRIAGVPS
ncbi:site-2 protease family protein [Aureimonas glaciei]|uniref:Peptidase M50 n=1 Tax=Aureimonas glaciei TaxID=1776957 RepID=A0A916YCW4_9HYPH|nr:site-2 protease family protein [Aureimonas glaciei]GGD40432.1 peptidase M50 [Aureimonas glaciei]